MATKIRAGLYETCYVINTDTTITYTIESASTTEIDCYGKWIVSEEISSVSHPSYDIERWNSEFSTKRQALTAIRDYHKYGYYKWINTYGWCYFDMPYQDVIKVN